MSLCVTLCAAVWLATSAVAQTSPGLIVDVQKISDRHGGFEGGLANLEVFGLTVESLDDLDGNGVRDLAVSVAGNTSSGIFSGALWILLLAADGTVLGEQEIRAGVGGFRGPLTTFDHFGSGLASPGDLDGDGRPELFVGAFGDGGQGALWVLSLEPDGTVFAEARIAEGEGGFGGDLDQGDTFGRDIAALGDVDGDGVVDLAVGAPFDTDGGGSLGAVWILFMQADGSVRDEQKLSALAGGFGGLLINGCRFGTSVAGPGDIDGDGIPDLAVGAAADDGGGAPHDQRGAVWIVFLNADGTAKGQQKIDAAEGGFDGALQMHDNFGQSLAGLGDLDGDGVPDLAVGADGDDVAAQGQGVVWVLFLRTDGSVATQLRLDSEEGGVTPTLNPGDALGSSLANLGDVDGDGVIDLATGARLDDDNGPLRGAVWVLFLGDTRWVGLGHGLAGVEGEPRLTASGTLLAKSLVELQLTDARANAAGWLLIGVERIDLPFAGGQIVPALEAPNGLLTPLVTNGAGEWTVSGQWPPGLPDHLQVAFQVWIDDPDAAQQFAASNALAAVTP